MKRLHPLVLSAAISLFFIVFSYYWYSRLGYVSAPGGDLYNHFSLMEGLRQEGVGAFFSGYPRLFHLLVLIGTAVSGKTALQVMLAFVPLVVIASGLAAYFFVSRLKGGWAGLLALVLTIFVARQPLQTLYDGGFPNFISVAIWLPLLLGGVTLLTKDKKDTRKQGLILTIAAALMMIFTHHFSASYLVILGVTSLFLVRKRWQLRYWLGGILAAIIVFFSPLGTGMRELLGTIFQVNGDFPWLHVVGQLDNPNAIIRFLSFPEYFGPLVFWSGLITMVAVFIQMIRRQQIPVSIKLVTILATVLLICSQLEMFRFPLRLARDAGVPLTLLAAYGLSTVLLAFQPRSLPRNLGLVLLVLLLISPVTERLDRLSTFEPTMHYSPAHEEAALLTGNKPSIAINQVLPSAAHRNIVPVLIADPENAAGDLEYWLGVSDFVLIEEKNPTFVNKVDGVLTASRFILIKTTHDPLVSVRLYGR